MYFVKIIFIIFHKVHYLVLYIYIKKEFVHSHTCVPFKLFYNCRYKFYVDFPSFHELRRPNYLT